MKRKQFLILITTFWFAVIQTGWRGPDGHPLQLVHGRFDGAGACVAFLRQYLRTFDRSATGIHVHRAFCIRPGAPATVIYP